MSALEETFTDKEFCAAMKVDRATSARWREQGIVGFLKLPNGQIRYLRRHIDDLKQQFANEASTALKDSNSPIKRSVVNIGVAKRRRDVRMSENA